MEQQYVGYGDSIASADVTKNDINAVVEGQKYIVDINQVYVDSLGQGLLLYEIYDKTGHELTEDELDISTIELGFIQNFRWQWTGRNRGLHSATQTYIMGEERK